MDDPLEQLIDDEYQALAMCFGAFAKALRPDINQETATKLIYDKLTSVGLSPEDCEEVAHKVSATWENHPKRKN